jgi:hypothetical protein
METAAVRIRKTKAEWKAIVEAQAGSHQSVSRFCREQGLEYKQFLYRRNKILNKVSAQKTAGGSTAADT